MEDPDGNTRQRGGGRRRGGERDDRGDEQLPVSRDEPSRDLAAGRPSGGTRSASPRGRGRVRRPARSRTCGSARINSSQRASLRSRCRAASRSVSSTGADATRARARRTEQRRRRRPGTSAPRTGPARPRARSPSGARAPRCQTRSSGGSRKSESTKTNVRAAARAGAAEVLERARDRVGRGAAVGRSTRRIRAVPAAWRQPVRRRRSRGRGSRSGCVPRIALLADQLGRRRHRARLVESHGNGLRY